MNGLKMEETMREYKTIPEREDHIWATGLTPVPDVWYSHRGIQMNCTRSENRKHFSTYKKVATAIDIATVFVPNPDNLPYVGFKDGHSFNNYADNLYWTDKKHVEPEVKRRRW